MNSGFSGESRASSSARLTTFSREASSNSSMVAVPDFFPKLDCTTRVWLELYPEVETVFLAYRMFPLLLPLRLTSQASALE